MNKTVLLLATALLALATACNKDKANAASPQGMNTTEAAADAAAAAATEAALANPNSTVRTIDSNLSGADAFEAIKKEHTGKVVLFDFWATWCPPCMASMKEIKAIKPELMKKGAVFVYITGETSPEAEWKNTQPTIDGVHYRLTDKQWAEIGKMLDMKGIPAFMILHKDGSIAFSNITEGGYPGNDIIKNTIEAALTK